MLIQTRKDCTTSHETEARIILLFILCYSQYILLSAIVQRTQKAADSR